MGKYREDWLRRKGLMDPLSNEEKDAIVKREKEVKREEKPKEPKSQKRPKPKKVKAKALEPIGEDLCEKGYEEDGDGYLDEKIDRLLDDEEIKVGSFVETNRWLKSAELKGEDLWDTDGNLSRDPEDCPFVEDPSPSDPVEVEHV